MLIHMSLKAWLQLLSISFYLFFLSFLINIKWSHAFNKVCLKEGLYPKYTKFCIYDLALHATEKTLEYRKYPIGREGKYKLER